MLITITDFKTFNKMDFDSTEFDSSINQCISSSIDFTSTYCNRDFQSGSFNEYYTGDGTNILYLDNPNIQSVEKIYCDMGGMYEFQELYNSQNNSGSLIIDNKNNCIMLRNGYSFYKSYNSRNIKVEYHAGYTSANLPQDLKQVLLELASYNYNNTSNVASSRFGIKNTNMNHSTSASYSYLTFLEHNANWAITLDKHKRFLL